MNFLKVEVVVGCNERMYLNYPCKYTNDYKGFARYSECDGVYFNKIVGFVTVLSFHSSN